MQWQFIIALVLIVSVILAPVVFIWYLNLGGMYAWFKKVLRSRQTEAERDELVRRMAK